MGFIGILQLVTVSKDYAFIVLHTSQITIGLIRCKNSATIVELEVTMAQLFAFLRTNYEH
jgi:hypothetical protein